MKLEAGQVAVVTGGASGIGLALARAFVARDLQVVIGDLEEQALNRVAYEIGALPVVTDVSVRRDVDVLAATTLERFGRVDIICNNAGLSLGFSPMWELHELDWQW